MTPAALSRPSAVGIRSKLLTVVLVFGIAPMLLVSIINYVRGAHAVESMLREDVETSATRMARGVEETLRRDDAELARLARLASLRDYLREHAAGAESKPNAATAATLPHELQSDIDAFYRGREEVYASLTCVDAGGHPLFQAGGRAGAVSNDGRDGGGEAGEGVRVQTEDIVWESSHLDAGVWSASTPATRLRSPVTYESDAASVYETIPIFLAADERQPGGALVVEIRLGEILKQADDGYVSPGASPTPARTGSGGRTLAPTRLVIALDQTGTLVYHTNEALSHQRVEKVMPFFQPIAARMKTGASGTDFYEEMATDGERWLVAYRPIKDLGVFVAVAGNYSHAVASLYRAGMSGLALLLLAALVATLLLTMLVGRTTHRIERVAAGAAAIAGGDLNQRIEVHTSDETNVLAESFNRMSDRLREQITREAETRQFDSFMRLSAMLTHDLKNSIASLSMLVSNMERQFHREEFREDAILSLREATEKLKRIVSRLSEPMKSLSGEYRRDACPTDLIPIIRRVLATTAEPSQPLYKIETRLPESLVAFVEAGRIENVVENLVINALEAMGAKGGRLTVEGGEEPNAMVYFSVADTGTGMSEEFLKMRLFRAFATTKNKGIGLGLYTCREIVEAHGGRLDVDSELGVGTRFRVVLPSKPLTMRERLQQSRASASASAPRDM